MNNEYTPDKWQIVKITGGDFPTTYKVFACWYGGYLGSDSWKMNSGITHIEQDGNFWLFEGFSGSVYKCHPDNYGTNMYGYGVLQGFIERAKEVGTTIEKLPKETDWLKIELDVS